MKPVWNLFDLPSLARTFDALECENGHRNAGFEGLARNPKTGDIKFARLVCNECPASIMVDEHPYLWMPAPALPAKQKRQRRTTHLPAIGEDFCWICNWDVSTLLNFGMGIQQAHPIDRAAAVDAVRDRMDDRTFPLCDYHHAWVDRERAQYAKLLDLYRIAGAVRLEATGVERPMLTDPKDRP